MIAWKSALLFLALLVPGLKAQECTNLVSIEPAPIIDGLNSGGGSEYITCTFFNLFQDGDEFNFVLGTAQICVDCDYWYVKVEKDFGNTWEIDTFGQHYITIDGVQQSPVAFAYVNEFGSVDGWEATFARPADQETYAANVFSDMVSAWDFGTYPASFNGDKDVCYDLTCSTPAVTDAPTEAPVVEECVALVSVDPAPTIDGLDSGGGSEYIGCTFFELYQDGGSDTMLATAQICVDCEYWYVKVNVDLGNAMEADMFGQHYITIDGVQQAPVEFSFLDEFGYAEGWEATFVKPANKDAYAADIFSDIVSAWDFMSHRASFSSGAIDVCYDLSCPTDGDDRDNGEGGSFGDPHLKTWRGTHVEFHAECDLLLVHSEKFGNGKGMTINIRTDVRKDWSFISDVVLRIGDETLEMNKEGRYFLNGKENAPMPNSIAGYEITYSVSQEGRVSLDVHLGERGHVFFREYKEFVSAHIVQGRYDDFSDSIGLMGDFANGRMLLRDGETEETDPKMYALEWQVRDTDEQLFREIRAPQYPQSCKWPTPLADAKRRRLDSGITREAAEKACADWGDDIEQCIYDVMQTGDLEMALGGGAW